ncbi:polyribonucleotide nucleotidyltransferase [Glycomyces algeriensis]|jgi:polyribonucleotide nucleotidyltransferase|uniref:Polyribonucleotide nucleotidyltransferase n=1 Tax=Glycomyces algeriensis TaxID=256037 RepID=A0A9W6LH08_9ACTN|nr:polyribonucleotide nucleotidyltransferase [Glycomyces algeriensis]MDA1365373.1 polyribonucleotide nucleotidyltransferase [Glycomyces algeriensis]MDR7349563.1 polyribonucleotide nucleotidyltransferase [Glycomyces algeriensis]GLI42269.1 polyribonucleotide nucleotidyltransferase [Glycomyces algeriensis]
MSDNERTPEAFNLGEHHATAVIDNGAFGTRKIVFSTGRLAKLAQGSAIVQMDDTVVLATTAASKNPKDHFDFFPLTVDIEERMYAAGRIPGSFFRREGRPSENAILTCRLIDRGLRPSFVSGLRNEVQVIGTILSVDARDEYDVVAMNGASMSTQLAGLPFSGPLGSTRIVLIEGTWVAFPTLEQIEKATFDMIVTGRVLDSGDVAIMMVEAEATDNTISLIAAGGTKPTEEVVASGLEAVKPVIAELVRAQAELAKVAAKPVADYPRFLDYQDDAFAAVEAAVSAELDQALQIADKTDRQDELDRVKSVMLEKLGADFEGREAELGASLRSLTKKLVRKRVITEGVRIDGRLPAYIRPLAAEAGILPRVHGSALFERGETQIMGVTTLNMLRMEQAIDTLSPVSKKRYMHNYNFPPYSTGETGRVGSPKRREIGHGALAERALVPVLPSREEFPYAIRQVSEALASNGSTSMGSVCASTMSLMNAGVPIKAPVAGIAMGLISEEVDGETKYVTLTDILGAEDAYGDMDFKVAGTAEFVTALQLDTKLDGLPSDVLAQALQQANDARHAILDVMLDAISEPGELAATAPRITTLKIPVDKIGAIIGPKGQTINQIQDDTGADITVEDDGTIYVSAENGEAAQAAVETINAIANPTLPNVGDRFLGTVVKTTDFGAFISLTPGRDGLLHISKVGDGKRVERVEDVLSVGDKVEVEIGDIDNRGKIYLDKVYPEGQEPEGYKKGRPAERKESRGDRGDRGDRGPRRDRERSGERSGGGERSERPASGGERGGSSDGERRRRRTRRSDEGGGSEE